MLDVARRLRAAGVLGLNERNSDFIMRLNPRRLYPRVDDKVLTKELATAAGMAVPDLYGVIANQGAVSRFPEIVAEHDSFVIKPAQGSGGNGILVITGRSERKRDAFRLSSGVIISQDEILYHLSNIVGGQYSLSGNPDKALVEYCVQFDPVFAEVSYQGVPDIRVIVYRGYPAMAMVRLPTRASDGKANLHQGAVGAGIDMGTGVTLKGVLDNEIVDEHLGHLHLVVAQFDLAGQFLEFRFPDLIGPVHGLHDEDTFLSSGATSVLDNDTGEAGIFIVVDDSDETLLAFLQQHPDKFRVAPRV